MRTIDKIITECNTKFGAPMGRSNKGEVEWCEEKGRFIPITNQKLFDCAVPLTEGYDKGGAYWGMGPQLRVSYTKDLETIMFYRVK